MVFLIVNIQIIQCDPAKQLTEGLESVFSCKDAAQQFLMYVCLCVWVPIWDSNQNQYKTVQDSTRQYKTVQDRTRQNKTVTDSNRQYKIV